MKTTKHLLWLLILGQGLSAVYVGPSIVWIENDQNNQNNYSKAVTTIKNQYNKLPENFKKRIENIILIVFSKLPEEKVIDFVKKAHSQLNQQIKTIYSPSDIKLDDSSIDLNLFVKLGNISYDGPIYSQISKNIDVNIVERKLLFSFDESPDAPTKFILINDNNPNNLSISTLNNDAEDGNDIKDVGFGYNINPYIIALRVFDLFPMSFNAGFGYSSKKIQVFNTNKFKEKVLFTFKKSNINTTFKDDNSGKELLSSKRVNTFLWIFQINFLRFVTIIFYIQLPFTQSEKIIFSADDIYNNNKKISINLKPLKGYYLKLLS